MSDDASVARSVDHAHGSVYDSRYLVTTYAPRGRASHLRSSASTWTRANLAAAFEPRLDAVVDHVTIHEQWRPRLHEDRSGRARSSPRGTCRFGHDRRSRPIEWLDVNGLRHKATSRRRQRDVAHPASFPWQGTPGVSAGGWRDPQARRIGRDSGAVRSTRRSASTLTTERSSVLSPGGRPHRPPSGARFFFSHITDRAPSCRPEMDGGWPSRGWKALTIRKGSGDGYGSRFRSISR
jgi:hypothetical protein